MQQVISECYMQDCEMITDYYARTDQLLVCFFNRGMGNGQGEREWQYDYRTLPEFASFLEFFSEDLISSEEFEDTRQQ